MPLFNRKGGVIRRLPKFLLATVVGLLCVSSPVDSFVGTHSQHGFHTRSSPIKKSEFSLMMAVSTPVDPAARFHSDMHRVLKSRRNLSSQIDLKPMERRKRPKVLTTDLDGAERVMSMLRHMVSIGVATEESYRIALEALVHRGRLRWRREDSLIVCAADEVGVIMHEIWGLKNGQVSTETCNLALQAYAVCATPRGNRQYAKSAQALLEKMEENGVEITAESLGHVVHAWSWQQENMLSGECARMAQENFELLLKKSPSVETLQQSYHWLLEAWSKSLDDGAKEKAEEILGEMIKLREKHPDSMFPNTNSFSNAILAWSKARGEAAASKAHELLEMAVASFEQGGFAEGTEPELIAFNGVLSAWGRIGRVDKAETVLSMLQRVSEKCPGLTPDALTYNNILYSHLRSKDKSKALNQILAIVEHMEKAGLDEPKMKPDSFSYNIVLKAWVQSRRPEAALEAVKTLTKMRELWILGDTAAKPSNHHYNIVINALAKSRQHLDARQAYELMLQMQTSKECQPDIITYTSVIECFSKSNDPEAADISIDLLRQATAIYEETKNPQMMPNMRTYSMVISAIGTNPTLQNVLTARELLVELLESYDETQDADLAPNAFPFNYALNCAANCIGSSTEKIKAFQSAAQTYNDLRKRENVTPDSYTYAFWFKCCNNLLPMGDIRTKGVTLAFEQCKADGLVSSETLRRLLAGTPPDVVASLLDLEPNNMAPAVYRQLNLDDLPPGWSRNVR